MKSDHQTYTQDIFLSMVKKLQSPITSLQKLDELYTFKNIIQGRCKCDSDGNIWFNINWVIIKLRKRKHLYNRKRGTNIITRMRNLNQN